MDYDLINLNTRTHMRVIVVGSITIVALAAAAHGASLIIDDFVSTQSVVLAGGGGPTTGYSSAAAGTAIGGERDIALTRTSGPSTISAQSNPYGGFMYWHETGSATLGYSIVSWDGADGTAASIAYAGLGGFDLAALGTGFGFVSVTADVGALVTMTVWDASDATGNMWSQGTFTVPSNSTIPQVTMMFSSMTTSGSGGAANFSNVGAIAMQVGNATIPGLDFSLDRVTVVPEPASTAALGAVGLLGFVCLRRRALRMHR